MPKKRAKIVLKILILIIIILILYFCYQTYITYHDNKEIGEEVIKVKAEIITNIDIPKEEPVKITEENNYVPEKLIFDFQKLKSINSDTVGWIKINNTNIDYPIVKGTDNSYYLNHSFYKYQNINGWIFENSQNSPYFDDDNTVIFGHNTNARTMFSELRDIYKGKLGTDINIYIYLENESFAYKVFSIYLSKPSETTNITKYLNDDIVLSMKNNSKLNFNIDVTSEDKILTLSTCNNVTSDRIIMHAKKLN